MRILIIKKIPGHRWNIGQNAEVLDSKGNRLIKGKYAVELPDLLSGDNVTIEQYNHYTDVHNKYLEKQAKRKALKDKK